MAEPMDYTMDEGHGHPAQNPNTIPQCQYQQPAQSSNQNTFASQSRDAHHYDPVHNTESWHQPSGSGAQPRPSPSYAGTHNISQWTASAYSGWQGFGEAHRGGAQGPEASAYPQQPGFMGVPQPSWGEMRGYEQQSLPFGYIPSMYAGNGASAEPNGAGRSSLNTSTQSQGSPMRIYPNIGRFQDEYVRRAARTREEAVRAMNSRMREEREAAGLTPSVGSYDYSHRHTSLEHSHSRRHNNPDWDSDDDDDFTSADPDIYTNPYRASLLFNHDMDEERRIAAARGALAVGKKVPSRDFVASLEKLDPGKDLKEADRTCMICYNEFGIQNPDGIVEHPIRLPKCKHVFGDKCIKKWFEDSDSCPYCRDKLPSEQVTRKHPSMDPQYQIQSRRIHLAAATALQAHGSRARAGYHPSRTTDELGYGSAASQYLRNSQDEYHYIMRGSGAPDTWSYSPPNRTRESAESRRRQARGRAGLGRPTSVGSARFVATGPPNPQNVHRAHLQSITPNTLNSTPANAPRRSITPGLNRQLSTNSTTTAVTPPRSRLSEASSSSSEEASPPVAIGSGVPPGEQHSPSGEARSYRNYMNHWADPYAPYLTPNDQGYFRPPNSRADLEHLRAASSSDSNYLQPLGDLNLPRNVQETLTGNRLSR